MVTFFERSVSLSLTALVALEPKFVQITLYVLNFGVDFSLVGAIWTLVTYELQAFSALGLVAICAANWLIEDLYT